MTRDTSTHAHKPTDTPDTINTAYQSLAARLVAHVVARELGVEFLVYTESDAGGGHGGARPAASEHQGH